MNNAVITVPVPAVKRISPPALCDKVMVLVAVTAASM